MTFIVYKPRKMNKLVLKSALFTGGSLICGLVFKMLKTSIFRSNNKQCDHETNVIIFYGSDDLEFGRQVGLFNVLCIYDFIVRAIVTLDVCMPSLDSVTLAGCLMIAQSNKVNVRIVVHNTSNYYNLAILGQNGIEVKVVKPPVRLEHEFVLIDEGTRHALAVLGSLDYTPADPNLNHDATLFSSDKNMLTTLKREFERVWNSITDVTVVHRGEPIFFYVN